MPTMRGISKTAPPRLEEVVDHYIEFFKRVEANFVPGTPVPPISTSDGVDFDRRPRLAEREALVAYLRRQ